MQIVHKHFDVLERNLMGIGKNNKRVDAHEWAF